MLTSLDQVVFLSLLHFKREETADFFMSDADVPSCLTFYFVCILFIFKCFFLNVCNTVMMTWCHVEMSAVLFLYVCVQASKEIIKLKSSVYAYISSSSPKQELPPPFSLLLLPRPALFIEKGWFGKHTPTLLSLSLSLSLSLLSLPCLPSRAQPRSPFFPFVIHLASSFHCRDKRAQCIVGRLGLKKGPLPCVCCGRAGFMLPPPHTHTHTHTHTHSKKLSNTHSSLALSFQRLRPDLCTAKTPALCWQPLPTTCLSLVICTPQIMMGTKFHSCLLHFFCLFLWVQLWNMQS